MDGGGRYGFRSALWVLALFLTAPALALIPTGKAPLTPLISDEIMPVAGSQHDYVLHLAEKDTAAGGDGFLSTVEPSSASSQFTGDVSAEELEFRSPDLGADIEIVGEKISGTDRKGMQLFIFLRHRGSNSTATFRFSLQVDGREIADAEKEVSSCNQFGSCPFVQTPLDLLFAPGKETESALSGEQLILLVEAETTCSSTGSSPAPGFGDCSADVAWGDLEDDNQFSRLMFTTNALESSEVKIHRPGYRWEEDQVSQFHPNDSDDLRTILLRIDVHSAFGREDLHSVDLSVRGGPLDEEILPATERHIDPDDLVREGNSLTHSVEWTYSRGQRAGDYLVELSLRDQRGNLIVIDRDFDEDGLPDPITIERFGVRANASSEVIHIPPGQQIALEVLMQHVGDQELNQEVEVTYIDEFSGEWTIHEPPSAFSLGPTDTTATALFDITAPEDLTELDDEDSTFKVRIKVRADSDSDGIIDPEIVQSHDLDLPMRKVDVHAAPVVSIHLDSDRTQTIANTTSETFDDSIPHPVEAGNETAFYLTIFNAGYETDAFQLTDFRMPDWISISFFVDSTGTRIEREANTVNTYLTPEVKRFDDLVIRFVIKALEVEAASDIEKITFEVVNSDNLTFTSEIAFTIQRTYGLWVQPVYDSDTSTPLGNVSGLTAGVDDAQFRLAAKSTRISGDPVRWNIIRPEDISENFAGNEDYTQWSFTFHGQNRSDPLQGPIVVGPEESQEIWIDVLPSENALAGHHRILIRFEDETDPSRAFVLGLLVEVEHGAPAVRILQSTANDPMVAGASRTYEMTLRNDGNSPENYILSADPPPVGWIITVEPEFISLGPGVTQSFKATVMSPNCARAGEEVVLPVRAHPVSTKVAYGDDSDEVQNLRILVESSGGLAGLMCEAKNPRPTTWLLAGGLVAVIAAKAMLGGRGGGGAIADPSSRDSVSPTPKGEGGNLPDPVGGDHTDVSADLDDLDDDLFGLE